MAIAAELREVRFLDREGEGYSVRTAATLGDKPWVATRSWPSPVTSASRRLHDLSSMVADVVDVSPPQPLSPGGLKQPPD